MDSQERLRLLVQRTWQLAALLGVAFIAVVVGYWYTQIVRGAYYRELAENNRLRELKVEAPRGVILDREGRPLVENVPSYFLLFDRGRSASLEASLAFLARTLERPEPELARLVAASAANAPYVPLVMAEDLTLDQVARTGGRVARAPRVRDRGAPAPLLSPRHADGARGRLPRPGQRARARPPARSARGRPGGRSRESSRPTTRCCAAPTAAASWWSTAGASSCTRSCASPATRAATSSSRSTSSCSRRPSASSPTRSGAPWHSIRATARSSPWCRRRPSIPTCSRAASRRAIGAPSSTRRTSRCRTAPCRTPTLRGRCSRS